MNTRAITKNKKVVTFGEVMLRLTTPNFQRFSQTNEFIATYGGSEANVAYHWSTSASPQNSLPDFPRMQWHKLV